MVLGDGLVHGDHYITGLFPGLGETGVLCKKNNDCYVTVHGGLSVTQYDQYIFHEMPFFFHLELNVLLLCLYCTLRTFNIENRTINSNRCDFSQYFTDLQYPRAYNCLQDGSEYSLSRFADGRPQFFKFSSFMFSSSDKTIPIFRIFFE